MDLTGTALYMGSPSAYAQIVADLELDPDHFELKLHKEILWQSDTATDAEVRATEMKLIQETGANDRHRLQQAAVIGRLHRFNATATADAPALALCGPWAHENGHRPTGSEPSVRCGSLLRWQIAKPMCQLARAARQLGIEHGQLSTVLQRIPSRRIGEYRVAIGHCHG